MDIAANAENRIARIRIAKSMSKQNCVQNNAVPEIFSGQLNKVMKVILVISKWTKFIFNLPERLYN